MSVAERRTSGGRVCKQSSFQPTACSMLLMSRRGCRCLVPAMTAVFARCGSDLPGIGNTLPSVSVGFGRKPELSFVGRLAEWPAGVRSALRNRRARAAIGRIDCPRHDRANCHRPGPRGGQLHALHPLTGSGSFLSLS